jgi:hypothetical protein
VSTPFLVSYAGLWLLVAIQSVMLFVLLREMGKLYLGQTESFFRDGPAIGRNLPEMSVRAKTGPVPITRLLQADYSMLLVASDRCAVCPSAAEIVRRWNQRSSALGATVLLAADRLGSWGKLDGLEVVCISPEDVTRHLAVRATPFLLVVDRTGRVLAKGIVNNHGHVKTMLRDARRKQRELVSHDVARERRPYGLNAFEGGAGQEMDRMDARGERASIS